jgi:long-chain acyl-CoA synthetase
MALRAVPVPTYVTNTVADHAHILRDSGARAAIVSTPALAGVLREAGRLAGGLDLLVVIDGSASGTLDPEDTGGSPRLMHWSALIADAAPPDESSWGGNHSTNALACLIYTPHWRTQRSDAPHRSIPSNCRGIRVGGRGGGKTRYLSYLPASHSFEHTVGLFFREYRYRNVFAAVKHWRPIC